MQEKKALTKVQQSTVKEKSEIQRIEEDFKTSIFNVVYTLLKDDEASFWRFIILFLIEFLQMLKFTFHENIAEAWKSTKVVSDFQTFLNFFRIVPWLSNFDFITYLVIFYICIFIIALVIVDFFYVTYSQSKKKFAFSWPIQALRQLCQLIITILLLPIIELLVSMLVCIDVNNQKVHYVFQDQVCWTGIYIIHGTFAILFMIIFACLTMILSLTFVRQKSSTTDASARTHSRCDTLVTAEKIVLTVLFEFCSDPIYQWFLIITTAKIAAITFISFYLSKPYHNERVGMLIAILTAIYAWSGIALLISKILEDTSFNGGLQLFFLGIPLVVALLIFGTDNRVEHLLENINNFQKGEEVIKQASYFLKMVQRKDQDRSYEIILQGYIFQHEDLCPNPNCQLKQYKASMVNNSSGKNAKEKKKNAIHQQQYQHLQNVDNYQLLLQHAKNIYRTGIQKFPTNSSLRVAYAFFLIDKLNKKQEALAELNAASQLRPPFDQQFVIYRYKRILSEEFLGDGNFEGRKHHSKDEKTKQNSKSNLDLMTRFAYESSYRQLEINIEKCAQFHLEFWNLLRDDRPDLTKLGQTGSRINQSIIQVDQIWNALQKINSNVPKSLRLYGKFLIEILHDKEGGLDLLQRAKDSANIKNNYYDGAAYLLEDLSDIQQMSSDGTPCIYVSGELDKIGMITQSNSGATRMFGYQSPEIKNHNVEKLMPEMYAKNHSKILEDALIKGPENIPNKERLVFARHKNGYVFPVWLQLKMVQNFQNGVQFVAMFKIDKKLMSTNIGFVLVNKERKVQGISSSCMKIMKLDISKLKRLNQMGYDLSKMAPGLFMQEDLEGKVTNHFDIQQFNNKQGTILEWVIPVFEKLSTKAQLNKQVTSKSGKKNKDQKNLLRVPDSDHSFSLAGKASIKQQPAQLGNYNIVDKKYLVNCTINNIVMGELGEIGWYLRLDTLGDKQETAQQNSVKQGSSPVKTEKPQNMRERIGQPLFQFRFDANSGKFVRELKESLNQDNAHKDPNFQDGGYINQNYLDFQVSPREEIINLGLTPKSAKRRISGKLLDPKEISVNLAASNTTGASDDPKQQLNTSVATASEQPKEILAEDWFKKRKYWGKGIQTYHLLNGVFHSKDIDDDSKKERDIEKQRLRKLQQEQHNLLQLDTFKNNIKSRKALHLAINDTTVPQAIRNLRMTMNLVVLLLLALAITEFVIISSQFNNINDNFNMIQKSQGIISEFQRIAYDIRSVALITEGTLTNLDRYSTVPDFSGYLKEDIEGALDNIYSYQSYISLSTLSVTNDHSQLLTQKIVPLYYRETNTSFQVLNFSLSEAVLQVASAIFTVRNMNDTLIVDTQDDVYFIMYNVFNDFLALLRQSANNYYSELQNRTSSKFQMILILFLCSLGIVTLSIPILFPAVSSVNKAKIQVLSLFIDIPNFYITNLSNCCEEFLNSYHDEQQQEEFMSDDGALAKGFQADNKSESDLASKRVIHKQPKNTSSTNRNFFIQFSFAVLVVVAYFLAMFILQEQYISNIEAISDEMQLTAETESYFSFAQNVQREMIYNPSKPILNGDSFNVSKWIIQKLYNNTQDLLSQHQEDRGILDQSYNQQFLVDFNEDLCENQVDLNLTYLPGVCSDFFSNVTQHGLQVVLTNYYETLRASLTIYQQLNTSVFILINGTYNATQWNNATTTDSATTSTINSSNPLSVNNSTATTISAVSTKTNKNGDQTTTTSVKPSKATSKPSQSSKQPTSNTQSQVSTYLLNNDTFVDLYLLQFVFIQDVFRSLVLNLRDSVNSQFESSTNLRMAAFIIYIIGIIVAYLILWTPFLSKLNREIWRTKTMLTIIPIELIMKLPRIQEYLNKQTLINSKKQTT